MDMGDTPVLETERLPLRPFTEDDLPAVFAIFSDREVNRFLPWFPVRTMEEAESFFQERYAAAYRDRSAWKFAICLKRDNIPIGYVTLSGDDSHDLGYGLRRESWGMGIATEAGQAGIPQAGAGGPALPPPAPHRGKTPRRFSSRGAPTGRRHPRASSHTSFYYRRFHYAGPRTRGFFHHRFPGGRTYFSG